MAKTSRQSQPNPTKEASSALSELLKTPVANKTKSWVDDLPPEVRQQLDEIRDAYRSGKVKHTKSAIHRFVKARLAIEVCRETFARYLDGGGNNG